MTATGIELESPPQPRGTARRPRAAVAPVARAAGPRRVKAAQDIAVRIWPFGLLATQVKDRPLVLRLPAGASAGDMIDAMGERYGAAFIDQLTPEPGRLVRCCRLFVDGQPVEDLTAMLSAEGRAVDIEIILIMGYEGG